jgi:hypothetical protein
MNKELEINTGTNKVSEATPVELTKEEIEMKKRIDELRRRDPFIYK